MKVVILAGGYGKRLEEETLKLTLDWYLKYFDNKKNSYTNKILIPIKFLYQYIQSNKKLFI